MKKHGRRHKLLRHKLSLSEGESGEEKSEAKEKKKGTKKSKQKGGFLWLKRGSFRWNYPEVFGVLTTSCYFVFRGQ